MGDYVTDEVLALLDAACIRALKANTDRETFMRVVAERWDTFDGLPFDRDYAAVLDAGKGERG